MNSIIYTFIVSSLYLRQGSCRKMSYGTSDVLRFSTNPIDDVTRTPKNIEYRRENNTNVMRTNLQNLRKIKDFNYRLKTQKFADSFFTEEASLEWDAIADRLLERRQFHFDRPIMHFYYRKNDNNEDKFCNFKTSVHIIKNFSPDVKNNKALSTHIHIHEMILTCMESHFHVKCDINDKKRKKRINSAVKTKGIIGYIRMQHSNIIDILKETGISDIPCKDLGQMLRECLMVEAKKLRVTDIMHKSKNIGKRDESMKGRFKRYVEKNEAVSIPKSFKLQQEKRKFLLCDFLYEKILRSHNKDTGRDDFNTNRYPMIIKEKFIKSCIKFKGYLCTMKKHTWKISCKKRNLRL